MFCKEYGVLASATTDFQNSVVGNHRLPQNGKNMSFVIFTGLRKRERHRSSHEIHLTVVNTLLSALLPHSKYCWAEVMHFGSVFRIGFGFWVALSTFFSWADPPKVTYPRADSTPLTCGDKTVVGPKVFVSVEETGLTYLARTDTGSDSTALNAWDLIVEQPEKNRVDNIGKMLRFRTANEKGKEIVARARIVDSIRVRSTNGIQERYVVELGVLYQGRRKVVNVSLSDRSHMNEMMLLGRDWLDGSFVVDVSLPEYRKR